MEGVGVVTKYDRDSDPQRTLSLSFHPWQRAPERWAPESGLCEYLMSSTKKVQSGLGEEKERRWVGGWVARGCGGGASCEVFALLSLLLFPQNISQSLLSLLPFIYVSPSLQPHAPLARPPPHTRLTLHHSRPLLLSSSSFSSSIPLTILREPL